MKRSRNITARDVAIFSELKALGAGVTHIYLRGAYSSSVYAFAWSRKDGKPGLILTDSHYAEHGLPPIHDKYRFMLEVESAWNDYVVPKMIKAVESGKTCSFTLANGGWIEMSEDKLVLHLAKKSQSLMRQDVAKVDVKGDKITIAEPGGKEGWFTSSGLHSIPYSDLANASAFLALLHHFFGVDINIKKGGGFLQVM